MSDTTTVIIVLVGFLAFLIVVIGFFITSFSRTKRNCPNCQKPSFVSKSFYQEKGSKQQLEGVIDRANGIFGAVFEFVVGILGLGWFIFMILDFIGGDCSIEGLSVVCESSSVSITIGIIWFILPLLIAITAPLCGIKRLQRTNASKGRMMECQFKCAHCKTEWTESITENSTSKNAINKKNQSKVNQDRKKYFYPLLVILLATATIVLIIFMTRDSREKIAATEIAQPQEVGSSESTEMSTGQPMDSESASTPQLVGTKQYSAAPPMLIDTSKKYTATITMANGGIIEIELYADKAPITVNSFVFLAHQGYFDGVTFHRVLEDFMAQGGDPTGTGGGGPGYEFEYEDSGLSFDKAGVVAMANTGPATPTNGSQFFITFGATPHLDGGYTIFGQVVSGMDVINGLTLRDPNNRPDYEGDVIESITITEE